MPDTSPTLEAGSMPATETEPATEGPWNPGIRSRLPGRLLPLSTIFRPENVFAGVERVKELRDLTGLDFSELVRFRPERIALHELLIRVTADLSVSDGSRYEDLGINFRSMVSAILSRYVQPDMQRIAAAYDEARDALSRIILQALEGAKQPQGGPSGLERHPGLRSLLSGRIKPRVAVGREAVRREDSETSYLRQADQWEKAAAEADAVDHENELRGGASGPRAPALRALARIWRALYGKVGNWAAASELAGSVAIDVACNEHCAKQIGRLIDQHVVEASRREGYRLLPHRNPAIVMNTKGPSASGKSTLRPLQHALADRVGADWSDFALISPDIWRKQLLEYAALGADHRYGSMLAAEELAIIDRKLDRYVAAKAERGRMTHLLIDRFRFGSFVFQPERAGDQLLSRFGQVIYFFFMITPPDALVERAWKRGLEVGRYKAVDDILAHGIEAYSGMPQLFLTWARRTDKSIHFEFLDNSVKMGQPPRTVAFGWNGQVFVLDVKCLMDVVRYRRVDVDATSPDQLFSDTVEQALKSEHSAEFLLQCVRQMREVIFADQRSGRVYLQIEEGRPVWVDAQALAKAVCDPHTRAGVMAVAPGVLDRDAAPGQAARHVADLLASERICTLGSWGPESPG
ncbi:MAG TPA: hypothetical protein VH278_09505 [Burkholderiaceae bacterium]|nr:hypothetical protein [Burkholderiaceae bacterium]